MTTTTTAVDDLVAFLSILFPGETGVTEARALPSTARTFVPLGAVDDLLPFLHAHAGENLFVGASSRRDASGGTAAHCHELWTVFVDIDFKITPAVTFEAILAAFPLAPTLIVESSTGGRHVYWSLREPFTFPEDAAAATRLLQRLAAHFGADHASAEIARVLRLPGTYNHKREYGHPCLVRVLAVDPTRRYASSEFDEWLPAIVAAPAYLNTQPAAPVSSLVVRAPSTELPPIVPAGSRNATLYRLARSFHAHGMPSATIAAALAAVNATQCRPPLPEYEIEALIAHVITQPDRADFVPPTRGAVVEDDGLEDAPIVVAEGQRLAETGVPFLVQGLVPNLGVLGFLNAFTKVGKSTLGQQLAGAVACGLPFLDLATHATRVLLVAAEDPPSYTAFLARHLTHVPAGCLTFYRRPIRLDEAGLASLRTIVAAGQYGFVLIASWQAVVAGLLRDENDNANAVRLVEAVKAATRVTGVPWLIDSHAGKGEDQSDEADPTRAMRGASGASGAADFVLSLRYARGGPFSTQRRLSGKGRFVIYPPTLIDYQLETGTFTALGASTDTTIATTWRLIDETAGALTTVPQHATAIARAIGLTTHNRVTSSGRRAVQAALNRRPGIRAVTETRDGKVLTLYARQAEPGGAPFTEGGA